MYTCVERRKPGEGTIGEFGELQGPWGIWCPIWCRPLGADKGVYRLRNGDEFERTLVLNDQLDEKGIRLRRGQCLQGYILGFIPYTFPAKLQHGQLVDGRFSVVDFLGRESVGEVRFMVDRSDLAQRPVFRNPRPAADVRSYIRASTEHFEGGTISKGAVRKRRRKPSSSNW
jgi:hypothetical protein